MANKLALRTKSRFKSVRKRWANRRRLAGTAEETARWLVSATMSFCPVRDDMLNSRLPLTVFLGKQGGCIGGCGYYCQCSNGGETVPGGPSPGQTHLVSTVVNGQTITATFEPTTISGYTALRQSTTITTTKDGKETALAIFAGGVAWWLLGTSIVTCRSQLTLLAQASPPQELFWLLLQRYRKEEKRTINPALTQRINAKTVAGAMRWISASQVPMLDVSRLRRTDLPDLMARRHL